MPKMKSNRGAAKRFRVTGSGKFKHAKKGRRHIPVEQEHEAEAPSSRQGADPPQRRGASEADAPVLRDR